MTKSWVISLSSEFYVGYHSNYTIMVVSISRSTWCFRGSLPLLVLSDINPRLQFFLYGNVQVNSTSLQLSFQGNRWLLQINSISYFYPCSICGVIQFLLLFSRNYASFFTRCCNSQYRINRLHCEIFYWSSQLLLFGWPSSFTPSTY